MIVLVKKLWAWADTQSHMDVQGQSHGSLHTQVQIGQQKKVKHIDHLQKYFLKRSL
jgi:hypothetical protein